ncbi:hypothetical protein L6452_02841 [Arctium lappa]|uniref:Uncharacterized protein n=1 Tax=Arctium lappa TaxID=4217 RepID=A0ACB9FK72_ARCLA|nr:hypothetical protein L6452_02841 [Arctium lappa]
MMFVDAKRKRHLQVEPNISLATLSASSEACPSKSHMIYVPASWPYYDLMVSLHQLACWNICLHFGNHLSR